MIDIITPPNPRGEEAPQVPASEAAQERVLTDMPMTLGYRPNLPLSMLWGDDALPPYWEVLRRVEAMASHPVISVAMMYYRGAIYPAEFEVKASSSEVGAFALAQVRRFWSRDLPLAQLKYEYGWGGYEVVYREKQGFLQYDGILEFSPIDVQVLTRKKQYVGIRVRNGDGEGDEINLWGGRKHLPAKGLWLTHNRRYHRWHGRTQYYAAYKPWWEVAARDGSEEVTCNGIYRFAYHGPVVRYPQGSENAVRTRPGDSRQDMRDTALGFADGAKAGVSVAMSSKRDSKGEYEWDLEWPDHTIDVSGLLAFDEAWVKKMFFGIGVPPEVIQASDSGSGYSGRAIPKEAFYVSQQHNADDTLRPFMDQSVSPLICWNFGPEHWAEVTVKPLLKTQAQQSGGMPGQPEQANVQGQPPGGGPPAPGGGPKPTGAAPGGQAPDLAALFGGGGKPGQQTQTMSLANGDSITWLTAPTNSEATTTTETLALPPVTDANVVAAEIHLARPVIAVEEIAAEAGTGYKRLLQRIRKELLVALRGRDVQIVADTIAAILRKYQPMLAKLLTDAKLSAALAGAWDLAHKAPDGLFERDLTSASILEQALYGRPAAEIAAARAALGRAGATGATPPQATTPTEPESSWTPPPEPDEARPIVSFPMIEEAAADLAGRRAMTRGDFDVLHAEARDDAFTVAGMATEAAIEKVRDQVAAAVAHGHTMDEFAKRVEDELGRGTFLSPMHMETVFRVNVMSGYAAGQERLLDDPRVGDYFPYVQRDATHDDRVRPEHLSMETHGIQGTNIYRRDDPVFQKYKAPWDYNCRCIDTYLTVHQAAAKGIHEAMEWERTGEPPAVPTYVPMPGFEPSPNWQRLALAQIGVQWLEAARGPDGRFLPKGLAGTAPKAGATALVAAKPADEIKIEPNKGPHDQPKKASSQFNLADAKFPHDQPSPIIELTRLVNEIPNTWLAPDGKEDKFHVTALYGLEDDDPEGVRGLLRDFGPVKMQLGEVSLFPADEKHDYDVVKVDVESPDLVRLHEMLKKLPHTLTHKEFRPHVTLAYVRPGLADGMIGDESLVGKEMTCDTLMFCNRDREQVAVSLVGKKEIDKEPAFAALGLRVA